MKSKDAGAAARAEQARQLVLAEWSRIIEGLIGKAVEGGYQQAKLLFDLCNWSDAESAGLNEQRRAQLCDALLEQIELLPPRRERAEIASSEQDRGEPTNDHGKGGAGRCEPRIQFRCQS